MNEGLIKYSCLAGNHLTTSHQGMKAGMRSSITGRVWGAPDDDKDLVFTLREGLLYWILDDSMTDEECKMITLWHNADQSQNSGVTDAMSIREVLFDCKAELQKSIHVKTSVIIARFTSRSIVQVNANSIGAYAKWIVSMGVDAGYVDEVLDHLARFVNSTELTVSPVWFEDQINALPQEFVLLKLMTTLLHYNGDAKTVNQRPAPDVSRTISGPEMVALGKNKDMCVLLEDFFKDLRVKIEPALVGRINKTRARDLLRPLEFHVIRMAYSKGVAKAPSCDEFTPSVVGKPTMEKLEHMKKSWLGAIVNSTKGFEDLPEKLGITIATTAAELAASHTDTVTASMANI